MKNYSFYDLISKSKVQLLLFCCPGQQKNTKNIFHPSSLKMKVYLLLLSLACIAPTSTAINFKQWKSCQPCLDAGYGWCPIRRMCGGFANRKCTGDNRDNSKTDEEVALEEQQQKEAAESRRLEAANSAVVEIEGGLDDFNTQLAKIEVSLVKLYVSSLYFFFYSSSYHNLLWIAPC
jgi:hypothetical protein